MEGRYFSELRTFVRRLQGWALQHYLHKLALPKRSLRSAIKNSHEPDLFEYFINLLTELYQSRV